MEAQSGTIAHRRRVSTHWWTAYKLVESWDILALLALVNAIEAEGIGRILVEKLATELIDDTRWLHAVL